MPKFYHVTKEQAYPFFKFSFTLLIISIIVESIALFAIAFIPMIATLAIVVDPEC